MSTVTNWRETPPDRCPIGGPGLLIGHCRPAKWIDTTDVKPTVCSGSRHCRQPNKTTDHSEICQWLEENAAVKEIPRWGAQPAARRRHLAVRGQGASYPSGKRKGRVVDARPGKC